jgi:glycosyltransferase involved in cell wall biosynthesis
MSKVSVILPNYNHSLYLKERIESILHQTFQDFELILLDDCSTDSSREILSCYQNHPRVSQFVMNETNSGSTFKQWNKGISLSKGEYIWIAESDDVAEPTLLENLVQVLENNPSVSIAYSQSTRMDSQGVRTGTWKSWTDELDKDLFAGDFVMKGPEFIPRFLVFKNVLPNASAILFKRAVALHVQGADETIRYCSDWLLWLKMLSISDVGFVHSPLNHFRFHDQSVIGKVNVPYGIYDIAMREKWRLFLLQHKMKGLLGASDSFLAQEYLKWGIKNFDLGKKWLGCKNVLYSAMYPVFNPRLLWSRINYCLSRLITVA